MNRSLLATALVLGACSPDIANTPPTTFVTAVFDPTTSSIPLPNDLVFLNPSNSVCPAPANTLPAGSPPACAQAELLDAFNGAFPSDQAISVTIDFTETTFDDAGAATNSAPDLDLTSFTPTTYFVYGRNGDGTGEIAMDAIQAADYVKYTDHGTLTLRHANNQPWAPGTYAVLVRGGDSGVKTTDGLPVYPSQIFYLLTQGKDLIDPANNGLLRAQLGSEAAAQAEGMQLNAVISMYNQVAFPAADTRFPHEELAIADVVLDRSVGHQRDDRSGAQSRAAADRPAARPDDRQAQRSRRVHVRGQLARRRRHVPERGRRGLRSARRVLDDRRDPRADVRSDRRDDDRLDVAAAVRPDRSGEPGAGRSGQRWCSSRASSRRRAARRPRCRR